MALKPFSGEFDALSPRSGAGNQPKLKPFSGEFDPIPAANGLPSPAAAPPRLRRTWGEAAKDTGLGIVQGGANLGMGLAQLGNLATFGALDAGIVKPGQRLVDRALGGTGEDAGGLAGATARINEGLDAYKSPALRQSQSELAETKGVVPTLKRVVTDPKLLGQFAAEQVPILATLGAGTAGTAAKAGAAALSRGAAPAAAQQAGRTAAMRANIGATGAMGAGFAGNETVQDVLAQPDEVWRQNPEFMERVARGEAPGAVKDSMALRAGQIAASVAGPLSAATAGLTARLETDIFTRALPVGGARALLTRDGARQVGSAVGRETAEEAIQEGGEQFAQNLGVQQVADSERGLFEGVPEAATVGGVVGGMVGGGLGAGGVAASRPAGQQPTLQPGSLSEVAAATPTAQRVSPAAAAAAAAEAAAPAQPTLRYPGAAPGSLADAANALPDRPVVTATIPPAPAEATPERPQNPLANLDPESGELLGIDAEVWPNAAEHQQPAAIVRALTAEGMARKKRPPSVARITETYNVDTATARALRKRAVDEMTRASMPAPTPAGAEPGTGDTAGAAPAPAPAADAAPAARAAEPSAPAAREAAADGVEAGASASPPVETRAEDTPAAPESGVDGEFRIGADGQREQRRTDRQGRTFWTPVQETATAGDSGQAVQLQDQGTAPQTPDVSPGAAAGAPDQSPARAGREPNTDDSSAVAPPGDPESQQGIDQGQASDPSPQATPAQGAAQAAEFVEVKDAYGVKARVRRADLDGDRTQLRLYTKDGKPKGDTIHRDNIDLTGEKRAARALDLAGNKALEVVTNKRGGTFKTATAAKAYATKNGYGDTHDASPAGVGAEGFVLRRKSVVSAAAAEAATSPTNRLPEPTEAQREAGNYQKGHVRLNGLDVSIENPAGSRRRPEWPPLKNAYGYIRGTVGRDKDHVDVFLTDRAGEPDLPVFVVDQVNRDGRFDEHKVVMGAADEAEARKTYLQNYSRGWTGLGGIRQMTQEQFRVWVRDPKKTSRRVTRKKAAPAAAKPLFSKAADDVFYSALLRAVEAGKGAPRKAGPRQWKQWLDGAQRRGDLKQGERDWLGVDGWLEGQESITREQIADYVRANQVQVQETELGDPRAATAQRHAEVMALFDKKNPDATAEAREDAAYDAQEWLNGDIETSDLARSLGLELEELRALKKRGGGAKFDDPKFRLPGGSNYRELLLTLPVELAAEDAAEVRALAQAGKWEEAARKEANARRRASFINKTHFDQPNILAHVRFDERTDADGKRVLFLEEIQSDWHQRGRKDGYRGSAPETADGKAPVWKPVPDAPFKTTWPMLAFKRMVRYAADHGFERIAWTTGEQQAARYELSKQVREIQYVDGERLIVRDAVGAIIHNQVTPADQIADVIGKDPAEKLLAAPARRHDGFNIQTITGDGLKVGGDGMKAFYDRMLPNDVNKLVKQFGGKVGRTRVPAASEYAATFDPAAAEVVDRGGVFQVWVDGRLHGGNFDSRDAAASFAQSGGGTAVHSVDITPDLRRAALGGQPLFSATRGAPGSAPLTFDRALQLKAELTGQWGENAPTVILVENAEEFPSFAKTDPDYRRGEGLFNGRQTVWINVGAIRTEQRFAQVLAHEALGHFGVEAIVGDQWAGIVETISRHDRDGTGSAGLRAAMQDVHRRYGELDATTFAKEVIAVMAERGVRSGIVARVVAAVRRYLRQVMPSLQWSETDVIGLLGQADSFLRAGRSVAASREAVGALSFSRRQKLSNFLRGAPVAEAGTDAFPRNSDRSLRDQVKDYFAEIGGQATSPDLGPITLSNRGIKSSIAHGIGRPKAAAFRLVPDAIAQGRIVEAIRDESGRSTNRYVIGAPVKIEGRDYLMGVVVKQQGGTQASFYVHEVTLTPKEEPRRSIKTAPRAKQADIGGSAGAIARLLLDAYAGNRDALFSQQPVQVREDGRGARSIEMGGETFLERSGRFYLANGDGQPLDFRTLGAATEAAQRTGGEVLLDDAIEGEPTSWSVVVPDLVAREAGAHRPLWSRAPADVLTDVEAVMSESSREGLLARTRAWLADATPKKIKDQLRGSWLGALTTRHLTELGQDYVQNIRHYSDFLAQQAADRNKLQTEGEAIAERARKWAGKHRAEAQDLFRIMHDATIDGVDPAKDYQPLQHYYGGQLREINRKNVKEMVKAIREQMLGRGGDNKKDMIAEAKALRAMLAREPRRRKQYAPLVERFNRLSPEAQQIYADMRDAYAARSDAVEAALVDRINDTDAPENHKRRLISTIRQQFETQRLQGVYFPLQRFGRYFVAAEKGETSTFLMFEKLSDLERAVKSLRGRGFTVTAQGLKSQGRAQDAPSGTFVAEVIEQLKKSGVSNQTQDEIYQIYLESLPELSMRKHAIHRKSVPGFDPDAVRAFAHSMNHGAHQLARLRWGHKMQNVLALLKQQQDAARREPDADTRKIAAGDAILEELNKRHAWINNPQDSQLTNMISSFGFSYYLGLTPAAAIVNLTQTPLISYPYLAARYGGVKAMNALLAGLRDSARTLGNIQKTLTSDEERRAHQVLQEMGAIDKTQAHNLAGIAEGGMTGYNPGWAKTMEIVGWAFHNAEVVNRESTGMAAFRLARGAGSSFNEAVRIASDTIYDTHYDYSNANRARFMQSGTAKVLLMFRQYSLNTTWHIGRLVWQATKGQSPEVRKLARRNLAGLMGMAGVFAGVLGLPLVKVTMSVLNAVQASFGDDDEPWDAETEFRAFLRGMLGAEAAELVLTGPTNRLTGADVATRVSLSELWFREADRELDGRGAYFHLLEQAAGPMGGVLKNALVGKHLVDEGHVWRGIETMLPKALKDSMKGIRYATEGVNNLRGDPVVEDPTLWQALIQSQGFTPARVAQQYEQNRSLKNYEQHILDRRQHLMGALAMNIRLGDAGGRAATLDRIQAFNQANPELAITPAAIRRSIQSRARYSARAEGGIVLNPKLEAKIRGQVGVD